MIVIGFSEYLEKMTTFLNYRSERLILTFGYFPNVLSP